MRVPLIFVCRAAVMSLLESILGSSTQNALQPISNSLQQLERCVGVIDYVNSRLYKVFAWNASVHHTVIHSSPVKATPTHGSVENETSSQKAQTWFSNVWEFFSAYSLSVLEHFVKLKWSTKHAEHNFIRSQFKEFPHYKSSPNCHIHNHWTSDHTCLFHITPST